LLNSPQELRGLSPTQREVGNNSDLVNQRLANTAIGNAPEDHFESEKKKTGGKLKCTRRAH